MQTTVYNATMKILKVKRTATFTEWLRKLKNPVAVRSIQARIARLRLGLFGDVKRLGNVSEIRIDIGPGYRVYFTLRGEVLVILLCGGDKRTQQQDIRKAHQMAEQKFDFEEE